MIQSLFKIKLTSLVQMKFEGECCSFLQSPNFSKNNICCFHNQKKILFKVLLKVTMMLSTLELAYRYLV